MNTTHNGHKNWSRLNVIVWLNFDETLYRSMIGIRNSSKTTLIAARRLKSWLPKHTPDGAQYTLAAIKAAMEGIDE